MAFNIEDFVSQTSLASAPNKTDVSDKDKVVFLSASRLVPASENFYSKDADRVRKLAASIEILSTKEQSGVQQALIVKPLGGGDKYEIIAGETRWAAVKLLVEEGRIANDLVPCKIERSLNAVREELILIMTNSTQRERSDAEKMEEISRLKVLLNEYKKEHSLGGTMQQAIADILSVSKTKVGTLENICKNLPDGIKELYKQGRINTSVANKIAGLPLHVQEDFEKLLRSDKAISLTVSDVNRLAEGIKSFIPPDTDDLEAAFAKSDGGVEEMAGKKSSLENDAIEQEHTDLNVPSANGISKSENINPYRSSTGKCFVYFEHCIAIQGDTYLLMFGHHINGGFICVPDRSWGCEASDNMNKVAYNAERLVEAGAPENVAMEMAKHIDTWLLKRSDGSGV